MLDITQRIDNTGIMGNEFFARDLNLGVPDRFNATTPGVISLSSGAFRGYDGFGKRDLFKNDFFVPYQFDWKDPVDPSGTPQNSSDILRPETVFESVSNMEGVQNYFKGTGGDPVVVANSHYARGAYWLTWDVELGLGESKILDEASWDKFNDYLEGKYFDGERNGVPFSALTVWYLPGLDHEAHIKGMDKYREHFINTTDSYINKAVDRLKELGEFDNKIFIVVSDHGHTDMPKSADMTYIQKKKDQNGNIIGQKTWYGYDAGELKLEEFNKAENKYPELANNNLHIWELADFLRVTGEVVEQNTAYKLNNRILTPKEISDLFKDPKTGKALSNGATENINDARIIAAFNGPMAHIYVKSVDWKTLPDIDDVKQLAEIFRITLQGARGGSSPLEIFPAEIAGGLRYKIGRLSNSVDEILVREGGHYKVYTVVNENSIQKVELKELDKYFNGSNADIYLDAVKRINDMNDINRSGDIVLIMRDKTSDAAENRYSSGVAYKSWHGSLNPSDSNVPFIIAYPSGNVVEIEDIVKKDSVCKSDFSSCKGNWNLSDIVKEIILEQFKKGD